MSYRIERHEPVGTAMRRIALEQTDKALAELRRVDDDPIGAVHECRKRCKKIRGAVRLVRPALGSDYQAVNRAARDAARALSDRRDSHATLGTFDTLVATADGAARSGALGPVRRRLAERAAASTADVDGDSDAIVTAEQLLRETRRTIEQWDIDDAGWSAVEGGVATTYGRGRSALDDVLDDPDPAGFHELRKRTKYTWYHLRLLRDAAPSILRPTASTFHDLSDALGDAHDLAVLVERMRDDVDGHGGRDAVDEAISVADDRRLDLQARSVGLAVRLFAEPSGAFVARLGAYWDAWQRHGDEPEAGEIDDLFEGGDGLDDLTVDALRALAREHDLPARSGRRKDELVAGLRAHGVVA